MMPLTGIVKQLLLLNVIVFIALHLMPEAWSDMFPFYFPETGHFKPFQIITYMFSHYELTHIFFNMLALYFMGPSVEMALGPKRFLGLYMISGLVALGAHVLVHYLPQLLGIPDERMVLPVLGASGAVYGVIIAFATLWPDRELMLLFPPIPVKAWVMALILVGIGLFQGLTGIGGNIANFAHLGGALAGYLLARHWKHGGRFLG